MTFFHGMGSLASHARTAPHYLNAVGIVLVVLGKCGSLRPGAPLHQPISASPFPASNSPAGPVVVALRFQ